MNKLEYQKYINEITPKPNKIKNAIISMISGGTIGMLSTILYKIINNYYNSELSIAFVILIIIIITSFITCLGFCDSIFSKLQCGLIIPITGFAHSISSSIIDYKKEGFITIGSNTFKLAGSVILYGVVSSIIFTLVKVMLFD